MKSRKIAILNFYYSISNYGAVLQAYALEKYLLELGYDAYTLNYRNFSKRPDLFLQMMLQYWFQRNCFSRFRKKWLRLTNPVYFLECQLNWAKWDFDTFIVGSDQVWRQNINSRFLSAYYLPFLSGTEKRIAYAVSFGKDVWEAKPHITKAAKCEVEKFKAISVREFSGVGICRDIFGVEAEHVLDPTLLVGRNYFDTIIGTDSSDRPKNKIVYYKLDPDGDFNRCLEYLSEQLSRPVKNIYYSEIKEALSGKQYVYFEVEEWLREIRDAEFVVTDSFHCICFCLLFEKQFIYFPNTERGLTRLESLLGLLGLRERIYGSMEDYQSRKDWKEVIDYDVVNAILESEREKSALFLKNTLES